MYIKSLLSLMLFSSICFSMEQIADLQQAKQELLADYEAKRSFFAGSPSAHRAFKAQFNNLKAIARCDGQANNYNLIKRIMDESFLIPAHEIQAQCNAVQQDPNSSDQQKATMQAVFEIIHNTSTFFTQDQDEFEKNPKKGLSSRTLFAKMLKDVEFRKNLYQDLKRHNGISDATFFKIRAFDDALLKKNGIHPVRYEGSPVWADFLQINEDNKILHNPQNYVRAKQLLINMNLLGCYFYTFSLGQKTTEQKLDNFTAELTQETNRIAGT